MFVVELDGVEWKKIRKKRGDRGKMRKKTFKTTYLKYPAIKCKLHKPILRLSEKLRNERERERKRNRNKREMLEYGVLGRKGMVG